MNQQLLATKLIAAALISTLAAGCGPEGVHPKETSNNAAIGANNQSLAAAAAQQAPQREAQFRSAAKEMYQSLFAPSCDALPGFSRDLMLSDEQRTVSEFEQSMSGKPGSMHLAVAKADAAMERGCSPDSDPRIAATHVDDTKETVRQSLEQLRALAPMLRPLTLASGAASTGGKFRLGVRRLIWAVHAPCSGLPGVSGDEGFATARERVAQLRNELSGTEFAAQFEVAEADAEFERSNTVVDCLPLKIAEPELTRQALLQEVEERISQLEALTKL